MTDDDYKLKLKQLKKLIFSHLFNGYEMIVIKITMSCHKESGTVKRFCLSS